MALKKRPAYNDPASLWLEQLSKAALIDCCVDLLRGSSDNCDDAVEEATAAERLTPVLTLRGDRVPKTGTYERMLRDRSAQLYRHYQDKEISVSARVVLRAALGAGLLDGDIRAWAEAQVWPISSNLLEEA